MTYIGSSAYFSVSLGSPNAEAVEFEKNCLETSTTILSISHMTMDSTPSCRATSRSTPPSPPPIIRTLGSHFHDECKHIYLLFLFSNVLNVSTHCTTNYTHCTYQQRQWYKSVTNPFRVWVRHHGQVGDHLLVGGLVPLRQLDHAVQDEDAAVVRGLEHHHLLELGHALEQDLLHLEAEPLARPHDVPLGEPSPRYQRHVTAPISRHVS